jgi:hypothetical protein
MRRNFPVVGLVLVLIVAFPRPARADLWDWLQEFSGPGPFHSRNGDAMFEVCPRKTTQKQPDGTTKTEFSYQASYDPEKDNTCIFFDYRGFINDGNDPFGARVSAKFYEVGVSARVHRAVELGLGFGWVHLSSQNASNMAMMNDKTKMVLTIPRLVVKPILFLEPKEFWDKHNKLFKAASSFKYYTRENIILGTMTAADFAVDPKVNSFRVKNDRVASSGFIIDVAELLPLLPLP